MDSEKQANIEELKHLVRYFRQATHEFFDDTSQELTERLDDIYGCLEQGKNSVEEYREMVKICCGFMQV